MRILPSAILFLAVVTGLASLVARSASGQAAGSGGDSPAQVTVFPGSMSVKPGQWFPVAVVIDLKPKWHIQTNDPVVPKALGEPEDFIKTSISTGNSSDGRLRPNAGAIQWPKPVMATVAFGGTPVEFGVFEGRVVAYLPVLAAADATPGVSEITLKLTYQACDDRICIAPVDLTFPVKVAVDPDAKGWPADQTYPEYFTGFDATKLPSAASMAPSSPSSTTATASVGMSAAMISIIVAGAALVAIIVGVVVVKKVL